MNTMKTEELTKESRYDIMPTRSLSSRKNNTYF